MVSRRNKNNIEWNQWNWKRGTSGKTSMKPEAWSLKPIKLISSQTDYEEKGQITSIKNESRHITIDSTNIKMEKKQFYANIFKTGLLNANGQIPFETHVTKAHSRKK